jgi:isopenicillin N synthase-like dioxygenase
MTDEIPPYIPPPPTKHTLDYAPLMNIDLSRFHESPEERTRLARELADASHNTGFWMVTGHGISDDDIKRQLALGQAFFKRPIDEKREFPCDFEAGRCVLVLQYTHPRTLC